MNRVTVVFVFGGTKKDQRRRVTTRCIGCGAALRIPAFLCSNKIAFSNQAKQPKQYIHSQASKI